MDPKKSLLFTPRMSPGERRLREARRQLMHASEDAPVKKIDPRDKDILRPPPTPVSPQQAAVAYSLAQAADPAKYPPTREQMERINSSARFVPPQEKSPMRRLLEHFSGTAGYGTTVPHGEEPADAHVDLEFHSNPGMDKAEERRKQLERPISPPETNGPEQEPKLVDPDDEKDDEEEP